MTSLLIRDLAQVATPAGTDAPLRGTALRDVSVIATTDASAWRATFVRASWAIR